MNTGKSYLRGHTCYRRQEPELCPSCGCDFETAQHALFECPAKEHLRDGFKDGMTLWDIEYDDEMTHVLGTFIQQSRTGFPVRDEAE